MMSDLVKTIKRELKNNSEHRKKTFKETQSKYSQNIKELEEFGITIIPNYYSEERCKEIIEEVDQMLIDYSSKVIVCSNGADERMFGANAKSEKIDAFFNDENIREIVTTYNKDANVIGFTLAGKLSAIENNLGSGDGWHRDRVSKMQTKAIIYLKDVNEDNGPFQYLEKSHNSMPIIRDLIKFRLEDNKTRFSDEEMAPIIGDYKRRNKFKTVTGAAGSLVLVDTRGLHRGAPIVSGNRYALTNYFWFSEEIPQKIQNLCL